MSVTQSLIDFTNSSENLYGRNEYPRFSEDLSAIDEIEIPSKGFKYNNSTRTPIIQRSKDNLRKKKAQKLARRKNRKK